MSAPPSSPKRRRGVLSLVERGWSGARECSLSLNAMRIPVTHLVKGWLRADVRAMIQPRPYIQVVSAPRWAFRIWMWVLVAWGTLQGRLRWVLMDHERSLRELSWWCQVFGLTPVVIRETERGYELWRLGSQQVSLDELMRGECARPGSVGAT